MGHTSQLSLARQAINATRHCLTGCAVGEVLGMVISAPLNLNAAASVILSTVLAFGFGYGFTLTPLVRSGLSFKRAVALALAADTVSIAVMELSDNAFILAVPGAINAGLGTVLFWLSLILSLAVAFIITAPVNYLLISRGLGHAVMHEHHH